jgi:stage V sporulation protein SpoVS
LSTSRFREEDLHEDESDSSQLTVAGQSKIKPVAGAIAGRIRENKYVVATAVGVDAVTNAVLAAGNARLYLEVGISLAHNPAYFTAMLGCIV